MLRHAAGIDPLIGDCAGMPSTDTVRWRRPSILPTMSAFDHLRDFITRDMRMSHIYQPVMLKTLLEHEGHASVRDIAAAFLAHDESQLEYYEAITKRMPGPVLQRHGLVARHGDDYALVDEGLTAAERSALVRLCDDAIRVYTEKRGKAIWKHRAVGLGAIPGRLRYETLARAGFHCELCGVSAEERALDVDHIVPRKHGGEDTLDNFQALCWKCNTNKGAGDDTDFRAVRSALTHRDADCVFCTLSPERVVAENDVAVAIRDGFPVTPLHTLVIPRRHVADYFGLHDSEARAMHRLLVSLREAIRREDPMVEGFNVGVNSGAVAGQTVGHCHVHLIPRRAGDVEHPRGGVRATIPGKADYTV